MRPIGSMRPGEPRPPAAPRPRSAAAATLRWLGGDGGMPGPRGVADATAGAEPTEPGEGAMPGPRIPPGEEFGVDVIDRSDSRSEARDRTDDGVFVAEAGSRRAERGGTGGDVPGATPPEPMPAPLSTIVSGSGGSGAAARATEPVRPGIAIPSSDTERWCRPSATPDMAGMLSTRMTPRMCAPSSPTPASESSDDKDAPLIDVLMPTATAAGADASLSSDRARRWPAARTSATPSTTSKPLSVSPSSPPSLPPPSPRSYRVQSPNIEPVRPGMAPIEV
mmetsp:Transcript_3152/g.11330  ORF Transcript_3152/g.11330 Transcript_3152/m.11330 type:complete len:279 (-) Transcript_3152:2473-3309(-)